MYNESGSILLLDKVPEGSKGFDKFDMFSLKRWLFCSIFEILTPWGKLRGEDASYLIADPDLGIPYFEFWDYKTRLKLLKFGDSAPLLFLLWSEVTISIIPTLC